MIIAQNLYSLPELQPLAVMIVGLISNSTTVYQMVLIAVIHQNILMNLN
jgi:hypothetical protein